MRTSPSISCRSLYAQAVAVAFVTGVWLTGSPSAQAGEEKPSPRSQTTLRLVVEWDSPSGGSPADILHRVEQDVTSKLRAAGYRTTSSDDYDFLVRIKYVATGFGDVGYEASLAPKGGQTTVLEKGVTVVSNQHTVGIPDLPKLVKSRIGK